MPHPLLSKLTLGLLALAPAAALAADSNFGSWPAGTSPTEIGRRVAERFVNSPHGNFGTKAAPKYIIYPENCAWYGALEFAQAAHEPDLTAALIKRFEPLFGPEAHLVPRPVHVDLSMFGSVPLEIYIETKDPRYLKMGQAMADAQWENQVMPKDLAAAMAAAIETSVTAEAIQRGLTPQTRFWVDDMWMITILQLQAYRATGEAKYLDRGAKEMVAYLDKLQEPNGLFHHAPDVPFFWGRGDGWFAAGMAEMLRSLPESHPLRPRIMEGYKKMMAALLQYQDSHGMWHQLIDHPEAWPETSCTGMFTYAFIEGVKHGWLDEASYGPAARKGWLGLVSYINPDGAVREVCEGTNKKNDLQWYLNRGRRTGDLHGQAPILWCAAALLR
ncbi:MAG TPA: glycoside hydrolase family 88 protein [Opitutaceae bacterium]|nr:glycoside hydrolase family 88 protein [Opitutaceae bacterium]